MKARINAATTFKIDVLNVRLPSAATGPSMSACAGKDTANRIRVATIYLEAGRSGTPRLGATGNFTASRFVETVDTAERLLITSSVRQL
jgi:hypothetical protein